MDDDLDRVIDGDGNEYEVVAIASYGHTVKDGIVHRWEHDQDGRREWTEPLCDSPVRDVLPEWIWDLVADPRND